LGISCDQQDNIITCGYFQGTVDFDPGPSVLSYSALGMDPFITKLNPAGNLIWSKQLRGSSNNVQSNAISVALDNNDNIYVAGYFQNSLPNVLDFDPGPGTFTLSGFGAGSNGTFLLKLDASGNFVWAKQFGDFGADVGYDLRVDNTGNIWCAGYFSNIPDFDPGSGTYTLSSSGQSDQFLLNISNAGNFIWAGMIGSGAQESGTSVCTTSNGRIYSTGYYGGTSDFNMGSGTFQMTPNGIDAYVYKQCQTFTSINATLNSLDLKIFPNPNSGNFTLDLEAAANIEIINSLGITIYNDQLNNGKHNFNISKHPSGLYILKLSSKGETKTIKLIKD